MDHDSLVNGSIPYQTLGKTLNDTDSISQEILDSVKKEELTDELLGCLAAELLALDEKDNNSCQIMADETDPESRDFVLSKRGTIMQELGRETTNVKIQVGITRIGLVCNLEDLGLIPGLGRSPGGGHINPLQ